MPAKTQERPKLAVHIRWMIRKDMPDVLAIERQCFEIPWEDEDFINALRRRNCIGMVAECDERVVGFMVYELHKGRLHVIDFAVHERYRRQGVGAAMIEKLTGKLSHDRRSRIILEVRETNLPMQLFLKSQGFRAVSVLRNYYEDAPDDAYVFQFMHGK